jgi:hypothetical protein
VGIYNLPHERASCKASATIEIVIGLASEDFRMTAFPQIKGMATARAESVPGAFQGLIARIYKTMQSISEETGDRKLTRKLTTPMARL